MKYFWVLLTVLITVQAALIQLTDDNFSDLVTKEDEWIVDFYADWCSYCKKAAPRIEAAERLLRLSSHKHVKVGLVNVETSPALAARFLISRLPTVVHIKDHQVRRVPSIRHENDIISFVTLEEWKQVEPSSGFIQPFSLLGQLIGLAGKFVKSFSSHSPWKLIGILTGFLVFALSLPLLLTKKEEKSKAD